MAGYLKVGVDEISGDMLRDIAIELGCPIEEPGYVVNNFLKGDYIDYSDEEWDRLIKSDEFQEEVKRTGEINYMSYEKYIEEIYQWLKENGYIIEDSDCLCASCNRSPCTRNWIIKLEK